MIGERNRAGGCLDCFLRTSTRSLNDISVEEQIYGFGCEVLQGTVSTAHPFTTIYLSFLGTPLKNVNLTSRLKIRSGDWFVNILKTYPMFKISIYNHMLPSRMLLPNITDLFIVKSNLFVCSFGEAAGHFPGGTWGTWICRRCGLDTFHCWIRSRYCNYYHFGKTCLVQAPKIHRSSWKKWLIQANLSAFEMVAVNVGREGCW